MFDVFADEASSRFPRRAAAYISGVVGSDGTGELDPIFVLPGEPSLIPNPAGTHTLAVYYKASRVPFEVRFTPSFVDESGAQLAASRFRLNVPLFSGITRVVLR